MNRKFLKYCLAAILFLVSVICLVFYLKVTLENRILVSMKSDLQKMLKVNTEGVLQWLNSQENAARLIASRPELKSSIFRAFSKELSYDSQDLISQEIDTYMKGVFNKKRSEFKEYFLLSTNMGYQGIRYGNSVILNGQIISQLSQLKKGDSFVQLPFIHKDNEHENIEMFIATPILNNSNKVVAVLGLLLDPETSFSRIMKASRFGNSAETFAINTENKMISEGRFMGRKQHNQFITIGLESNILNIEIYLPKQVNGFNYPLSDVSTEPYINYTGNTVIGAWTFIPKYNFTLISEISKNEAYEPLLFFRKVYLIIIGIILLLSISLLVSIVFSFSSRKKLLFKLKKIGNYQIYKQIGEGALGVVYEGKHQYLQRKTALKVLKPEVCTEKSITSFKNEVRLSSQLTHPNTISIYDYGRTDNNLFYYAMEFVNGMDLRAFQKITGPIHYERVIFLLIQVCGSLSEAHKKGLIHRDIKPHNIMVCNQGGIFDFVKVLDFGLVVDQQDKQKEVSLSGTPLFMAPESILNSEQIDHRIDIYALGVTAFYMITGKYPIADESSKSTDVLANHIRQPALRLSDVMPNRIIPPKLEYLISECLEKEPNLRPQDMDQLSAQLKDCQENPWNTEMASLWWRKNPFMLRQEMEAEYLNPSIITDSLNKTHLSLSI